MRGQLPAHARTVQKRDHLWAMLVAAGVYSWGEIAAATGERLDYLEQKAQTVPFQALVEEYRRRFTPIDTDEQEIARENVLDTRANLDFLRNVRDGKLDEVPHVKLAVRVAAARTLHYGQIARKDMAHPLNIRDHPALDHKRKLVLERILDEDMEAP